MITIERLSKRYGEVTAVDEVSMTVEPRTISSKSSSRDWGALARPSSSISNRA